MSADTPADYSDDLGAREVLLGVLNAFDADDRAVVCDYVFKKGPDRHKLDSCSTVRYQAACMVDALALDIRFDSGVDLGFFTQQYELLLTPPAIVLHSATIAQPA